MTVFFTVILICCTPAAASFIGPGLHMVDKGIGTVSLVNETNRTLEIADPRFLEYSEVSVNGKYVRKETWRPAALPKNSKCFYSTINPQVYSVIRPGDTVAAGYCYGCDWMGPLARLDGPDPETARITDLFGSPQSIPFAFAGNITMDIQQVPDCSRCDNHMCEIKEVNISLMLDGIPVKRQVLAPNDTLLYSVPGGPVFGGQFIGGNTLGFECGVFPMLDGASPYNTFVIHAEMPGTSKEKPEPPQTEKTPAIPGFTALHSAGGIISLVLLRRRDDA